ncbi:FAD-binding oxidoreductase [Sphingoaurantiacus capsulatus]|uniref:FAD-binding oxidoreductase n=1 Tax=Sphingoaurantiacus capsulatus TaxID=1771310 RepID=A0ABV7XB42_9SPHN
MNAFQAMKDAAGPGGWIDDPALLEPHLNDWRGRKRGRAELLLRPATTDQLAAIVRLAAQHRIGLVPQGGNTSLCGASVPEPEGGAVIVSTTRMRRVRQVDAADHSLVVEAGVTLSEVHAAAEAADRMFPLSLGAKGTATVGGLISTNAGGVQVLRYGTMRALTLGIEAVLPDGSVLDQLSALRKDNTGYDVKQLLIGAEGTLGFVTAAALKLVARPRAVATALAGLASPAAALALLDRLRGAVGDQVDSFELMPRTGFDLVFAQMPEVRDPFGAAHPWYALVELTSPRDGDPLAEALESALAAAIEAGDVADAVFAASETQRAALWALREGIPPAERAEGPSVKHDVSVPVARMPAFIAEATPAIERGWPGARVLAFGHLGDGNVHFNARPPLGVDYEVFRENGPAITRLVNDITVAHGGSISAEHGIGTLKRDELVRLGDPAKLSAMRAIKVALDPLGIMNPGKLL